VRPSRLQILISAIAAPLLLWAALPLVSYSASLDEKISGAQHKVNRARGQDHVLSRDIAGYSARINSLQVDITSLERREAIIQAELDVKQAQLASTQEQLRKKRARLGRLKATLAKDTPATPSVRTCTSRFASTAPRSIRRPTSSGRPASPAR
jgi:peptidoglycan hydrolase CwlO-like protein